MSSSLPYVTFHLPFSSSPTSSGTAPAISLAGSEHKGLFPVSAGYWKTGNVLSSPLLSSRAGLCLFSCSPGRILVTALPRLHGGDRTAHPEGTAGNRKNSEEIPGVGLSQHLQTAQISPCKPQAESWLVFYKVPRFGGLTAVKRQKKTDFVVS